MNRSCERSAQSVTAKTYQAQAERGRGFPMFGLLA